MGAGSVTLGEETLGTVKKIKYEWTAGTTSSSGAVSQVTTEYYNGKILGLATVPGTGSDQPTGSYDIELLDASSVDVLMGGGANRHDTNTEYVLSTSLGAVANDQLTISITSAGSANTGIAYVFIR